MDSILGIIFLCLVLSYILSDLAEKLTLPSLVGPLLSGLILGLPIIKDRIFTLETINLIESFSEIGIVFLMFFVGLSIDVKRFKKDKTETILAGVLPFVVSIFAGFLIGWVFSLEWRVSALIGLCLAVASEDVAATIMINLKAMGSRISSIILGAGTINDIMGIVSLGLVVTIFSSTFNGYFDLYLIVLYLTLFMVMVYLSRFLIIPVALKFVVAEKSEVKLFMVSIMIAMLMAAVASFLGLSSILGALLAGMMVRYVLAKGSKEAKKDVTKIEELVEVITMGYFSLFFFLFIGMHANFSILITNPLLGILIALVAFFVPLTVCMFITGIGKKNVKEGWTIGWALVPRGAIGLVIANLAVINNIINDDIYSALIFMTFTTTVIAPIVFRFLISKKYYLCKTAACRR